LLQPLRLPTARGSWALSQSPPRVLHLANRYPGNMHFACLMALSKFVPATPALMARIQLKEIGRWIGRFGGDLQDSLALGKMRKE